MGEPAELTKLEWRNAVFAALAVVDAVRNDLEPPVWPPEISFAMCQILETLFVDRGALLDAYAIVSATAKQPGSTILQRAEAARQALEKLLRPPPV